MPDATPGGGSTEIFGKSVKNKNLLIGGVVVVGLIVGIGYYRSKQAANAAASATTNNANSSNIDPATGDISGSAADQAALAAQSGGGYGGYSGSVYGGGTYPNYPGTPTVPQGFTNNAEWTQAAEQFMGSSGSDSIAAALGKYIGGAVLSTDQVTIVQEAIASQGYPPVAGPDGDPPGYKTGNSPNPNPNPNPNPDVTVPNVTGQRADDARQELRQSDLRYNISDTAQGSVTRQSPKGGTRVKRQSTVVLTLRK